LEKDEGQAALARHPGFRTARRAARLVQDRNSQPPHQVTRFGKLPILVLLLAIAALAASVFGALHNQLSYSVGPSYFTALKFDQFGIDPTTAPRVGAALVGVQAAWWMGPLVALPAFLYGFVAVPRTETFFAAGIGAIGLVVVLATMAALGGLVGGIAAQATGVLDTYLTLPEGPTRADFYRAGFMHDASYVAGALGLPVAFWPMRRARRIDMARAGKEATDAA
jgi:hypothetical protein